MNQFDAAAQRRIGPYAAFDRVGVGAVKVFCLSWNVTPQASCIRRAKESQCPSKPVADLALSKKPVIVRRHLIDKVPIEVLARSLITDRTPVEVEDYYGAEDLVKLRKMLSDPDYSKTHQTIATLIGLISEGSDDDVAALVDHAQTGSDVYAVMMALGYVAERTKNEGALRVLMTHLNSDDEDLAAAAILGLGLSGDEKGLEQLMRKAESENDAVVRETIETAIGQSLRVYQLGIRGHYTIPMPQPVKGGQPTPVAGGIAGSDDEE